MSSAPTPAVVVLVEAEPVRPAVAGASSIYALNVLLIVVGFCELVSSSIVIHNTSGYYIGGLYLGIIAMLSGSRGLLLKEGRASLVGVLICSLITFIVAIVAASLQASAYNFLITLEACATPADSATTECNTLTPVYYECDGDSSAYLAAYGCARANDDGSSNQCSCVTTSSTSATCYTYSQFNNCGDLLDSVPRELQVSYAFSVLCLLLSAFISILCIFSLWRPTLLGGEAPGQAKTARTTDTSLRENINPAHQP